MVPRVSLIGNGLCSRSGCLSTLLLRMQRTCAAFLLMLQVGKSGLMLLSPQSHASKPDEEELVAKPQKDDLGGSHLSCLSSASLLIQGGFGNVQPPDG